MALALVTGVAVWFVPGGGAERAATGDTLKVEGGALSNYASTLTYRMVRFDVENGIADSGHCCTFSRDFCVCRFEETLCKKVASVLNPVSALLKGKHRVDSENVDNEEVKQSQGHDAPYGDDYRADEKDYFKDR